MLELKRPSGVVSGDVLIAVIDVRANGSHKLSAPAGWNLVRRDSFRSSLVKSVYVRVATSSEPATYTFSANRASPTNGLLLALTGVDPQNPVLASSAAGASSSRSILAPGVSAPQDGGLLIGLFATSYNTAVTPPSGMTEQLDFSQPSAEGRLTSAAATQPVGSGDTGDRTATAGHAADNIGQLLLLRAR